MLNSKSFLSLFFAFSLTLSSAASHAASDLLSDNEYSNKKDSIASSLKSVFPNFLSFTVWLHQHATFECPTNPENAALMIKPIARLLYTGLKNIENVNSELLHYKLNESAHRKVLITCVPEKKERKWGGLYDPTPVFMDSTAIRFSHFGNLILIPEDTIKKLISEDIQSGTLSEEKPMTLSWFIQSSRDSALYEKDALLHEFLHFLQFDNNQLADHNDVNISSTKVKADDDVVYSCAEISYPFWVLRRRGPGVGKMSLRKSCYMCAMAEIKNGKVRVDETRASAAASACSSIPKMLTDMQQFWWSMPWL